MSTSPGVYYWRTSFRESKVFCSTQPSHNLSEKYLGPFEILVKAGTHSYTLCILDTIHGVHLVFHVSMLEPATPNEILNCFQSPPINVQGELEYEIFEVLDSKIDCHQSCKLLYHVYWLGYENTDEKFSWLPTVELEHTKDLISNFHSAYPHKPGPLSNL